MENKQEEFKKQMAREHLHPYSFYLLGGEGGNTTRYLKGLTGFPIDRFHCHATKN